MKEKALIVASIILAFVSFIALPMDTSAKTIKEFEAEVENYTNELEEKKANIAKNDAEVAQIEKRIKGIDLVR